MRERLGIIFVFILIVVPVFASDIFAELGFEAATIINRVWLVLLVLLVGINLNPSSRISRGDPLDGDVLVERLDVQELVRELSRLDVERSVQMLRSLLRDAIEVGSQVDAIFDVRLLCRRVVTFIPRVEWGQRYSIALYLFQLVRSWIPFDMTHGKRYAGGGEIGEGVAKSVRIAAVAGVVQHTVLFCLPFGVHLEVRPVDGLEASFRSPFVETKVFDCLGQLAELAVYKRMTESFGSIWIGCVFGGCGRLVGITKVGVTR